MYYKFLVFSLITAAVSTPGIASATQTTASTHSEQSSTSSVYKLPPSNKDAYGFAREIAMGADCGDQWLTDPPLQDSACYGRLPPHIANFLRNIPDNHLFLTDKERKKAAQSKQTFKAVNGLGARPDYVVSIYDLEPFWLRSFEGKDPDSTIYLVYGPECDVNWKNPKNPSETKCFSSADSMRKFKLYRVYKNGLPQDVTKELAPLPPELTAAESKQYGRYIKPKGNAQSTDIKLDVTRLQYTPVMRWVLAAVEEGDYELPRMPTSDQRAFKEYENAAPRAHFGFLVWNGTRFDVHKEIPSSLWPCRTVQPGKQVCASGYEKNNFDRFLIKNFK